MHLYHSTIQQKKTGKSQCLVLGDHSGLFKCIESPQLYIPHSICLRIVKSWYICLNLYRCSNVACYSVWYSCYTVFNVIVSWSKLVIYSTLECQTQIYWRWNHATKESNHTNTWKLTSLLSEKYLLHINISCCVLVFYIYTVFNILIEKVYKWKIWLGKVNFPLSWNYQTPRGECKTTIFV